VSFDLRIIFTVLLVFLLLVLHAASDRLTALLFLLGLARVVRMVFLKLYCGETGLVLLGVLEAGANSIALRE
jgi:hypothetical protein